MFGKKCLYIFNIFELHILLIRRHIKTKLTGIEMNTDCLPTVIETGTYKSYFVSLKRVVFMKSRGFFKSILIVLNENEVLLKPLRVKYTVVDQKRLYKKKKINKTFKNKNIHAPRVPYPMT